MVCYACGKRLTDKEILMNSLDCFIENKCLCSKDLNVSDTIITETLVDEYNKISKKK